MSAKRTAEESLLKLAWSRGLLLAAPDQRGQEATWGAPPCSCGVSLSYLLELAQVVRSDISECSSASISTSTAAVLHRLGRGCNKARLWDYLPSHATGRPTFYVVHAWGGSFLDLVSALQDQLAPEPLPGEPPLPPGHREGIMLWLDLFAVSHSASPKEHCETASMIAQAQATCTQGLIFVVDRSLSVFSRGWCIYELYLYHYYTAEPNVLMALAAGLSVAEVLKVQELCRGVDISKGEVSRTQDKTMYMSEVRGTWGLQRTNRQLAEELSNALHCRLRWTSRPEDKGNLAALLLQLGELSQLQLLLCSLPGLKSDMEALQEIRSIFTVYDSDGSGQLDEEEFVQVMKAAGWSEQDALSVFHEVDTDGGGSVEVEEFEAWWERTNQQDGDSQVQASDLTLPSLAANVERMPTYMRRWGLEEHAAFFANGAASLAAAAAAGGDEPPHALPPPAMRGDVAAALNAVADATKAKQYRTACKAMYNLLLANRILLAFPPPSLLHPDSPSSVQEQAQLLAMYMCLLGQLLEYCGTVYRSEIEYLDDTASDLFELAASGGMADVTAAHHNHKHPAATPKADTNPEMREMMRVFGGFYGRQSRINGAKAREEQFSVCQFLAARKRMRHAAPSHGAKATSAAQRAGEAVSSLSLYKMGAAMPSLAELRERLMREGSALPFAGSAAGGGAGAGSSSSAYLAAAARVSGPGAAAQERSKRLSQAVLAMQHADLNGGGGGAVGAASGRASPLSLLSPHPSASGGGPYDDDGPRAAARAAPCGGFSSPSRMAAGSRTSYTSRMHILSPSPSPSHSHAAMPSAFAADMLGTEMLPSRRSVDSPGPTRPLRSGMPLQPPGVHAAAAAAHVRSSSPVPHGTGMTLAAAAASGGGIACRVSAPEPPPQLQPAPPAPGPAPRASLETLTANLARCGARVSTRVMTSTAQLPQQLRRSPSGELSPHPPPLALATAGGGAGGSGGDGRGSPARLLRAFCPTPPPPQVAAALQSSFYATTDAHLPGVAAPGSLCPSPTPSSGGNAILPPRLPPHTDSSGHAGRAAATVGHDLNLGLLELAVGPEDLEGSIHGRGAAASCALLNSCPSLVRGGSGLARAGSGIACAGSGLVRGGSGLDGKPLSSCPSPVHSGKFCPSPTGNLPSMRRSMDLDLAGVGGTGSGRLSAWVPQMAATNATSPSPMSRRRSIENEWAQQARLALVTLASHGSAAAAEEQQPLSPAPAAGGHRGKGAAAGAASGVTRRHRDEGSCSSPARPHRVEAYFASSPSVAGASTAAAGKSSGGGELARPSWGRKLPDMLMSMMPGRRGSKESAPDAPDGTGATKPGSSLPSIT